MAQCVNCSNPIEESFKHCPHCSQKTKLTRLTLKDIGHDAFHYFTHADKGILQLLKELTVHTGTVAREFVSGKRKKYFPPLNFYLIVATIAVLSASLFNMGTTVDVVRDQPDIQKIEDAVQRENAMVRYQRRSEAGLFINKYSNVVAMVVAPFICLFYWLFYIRGRYNYTEHLIACMYMVGFMNLFYSLLFIPVSMMFGVTSTKPSFLWSAGYAILQIMYFSVFYYNFIDRRTIAGVAKAIATSVFAILFWFVLSGFIVGLYIQTGFWGLLHH